eukprot:c9074_g1_i1.p1 GENE.c9074_g1_i1~~c9074_g1_i1.p1  ORF type:complete len:634 (+),score=128.57 c9074_g1_i1:51-1952(+)
MGISLIVTILFSSSTVVQNSENTWVRAFGGSNSDEAQAILPLEDGHLLVAGTTSSIGAANANSFVSLLDSTGSLVWVRSPGDGDNGYGVSINQVSDGFILYGYTDAGVDDVTVTKFDKDGNLVWQKTIFSGSNFDVATASAVSPSDSRVVFTGSTRTSATNDQVLIFSLFSNGSLSWAGALVVGTNDVGNDIQYSSDGGILVAGTSNSNAYLAKIRSNGTLWWLKTITVSTKSLIGNAVREAPDGSLFVVGSATADIFLTKFNADGVAIATTLITVAGGAQCSSMTLTADSSILIVGRTLGGTRGEEAVIIKTDFNGNILFSRIIGGNSQDWAKAVFAYNDGGIAFAGRTLSFGISNYDLLVGKLDATGLASQCGWTNGTTATASIPVWQSQPVTAAVTKLDWVTSAFGTYVWYEGWFQPTTVCGVINVSASPSPHPSETPTISISAQASPSISISSVVSRSAEPSRSNEPSRSAEPSRTAEPSLTSEPTSSESTSTSPPPSSSPIPSTVPSFVVPFPSISSTPAPPPACQNRDHLLSCSMFSSNHDCNRAATSMLTVRDVCPTVCGCCDLDGKCICNNNNEVERMAHLYGKPMIKKCEDALRLMQCDDDRFAGRLRRLCPCFCGHESNIHFL